MPLTHEMKIEPHMMAPIYARFSHAAPDAIARHLGDRTALVCFLAQTHDLTTREAADLLDGCQTLRTAPLTKAA